MRHLYIGSTIVLLFATLTLAGCGGSGGSPAPPPAAPGITENVTALADVSDLKPGGTAYLLVNTDGFTVTEHPVTVNKQWLESQMLLTLAQCADGTKVGPGFSGSPLIVKDKNGKRKVWGPLFSGFGGDNLSFIAHPVQDMVPIPRAAGDAAQPSGLSYVATGFTPERWQQLRARDQKGVLKQFVLNRSAGRRNGGRADTGVPPPIAGRSLAVNYLTGDVYTFSAVGTFTVFQNNRWLVFGHPLDWAGNVSLPVSMATVDAIVTQYGFDSFKLARPVGGSRGTLTEDRLTGCSVRWGVAPGTGKLVTTFIGLDGKKTVYRHDLAKTGGGFLEQALLIYGLAYSADSARDKIAGGSAHVRLHLELEGIEPADFESDVTDPDDLTIGVGYFIDESLFSLLYTDDFTVRRASVVRASVVIEEVEEIPIE